MTQKLINLAPTTEKSSSYQTSNTVSTRDFKVLRRKVDGTTAALTVAQGEIDLRVTYDDVINAINISEEGIIIQANRVNLSGLVTFSNLSTAGQTTINGANIQTGTITALGAVTAGSFNLGNGAFQVSSSGELTASGVNISGLISSTVGDIGGFDISSNNLKSGDSSTFVELNGTTSSFSGLRVGSATGSGLITRYYAGNISSTDGGAAYPLYLNGSKMLVASNFSLSGTTLTINI